MHDILVYHDLGAPSHYRALEVGAIKIGAKVIYGEFAFIKKFYKDISQKKAGSLKIFMANLGLYLALSLGLRRPDTIVIGIAPFDWRILSLLPLMFFSKVQLHTSWPHWNGEFNAMKPRLPGIITLWKWVFKNKITHVYFVTEIARKNCEEAGFVVKSYSVVQHSLDTSIYKFLKNKDVHPIAVGYVGRLEGQKGLDIIFRLAARLHDKGFRFFVAGSGELEPEVQRLEACGILSYAGTINDQSKLADFYSRLHCILLPSLKSSNWEELFGMVLIEAAACGVVPIATDHVGPREVIKNLGLGRIYPESGYEGHAEEYLRNFHYDSEVAQNLADAAQTLYSLETLSMQWIKGLAKR